MSEPASRLRLIVSGDSGGDSLLKIMASKILVPGARVFIHCSKRGAPKNPLRGGRGAARTDGDARL